MKLFQKFLLAIGLLGILMLCLVASIESKFLLAPHIDTVFAKGFSIDNFKKVSVGMKKAEVQKLLGEPIFKIPCGGCWEPTVQHGGEYDIVTQNPVKL